MQHDTHHGPPPASVLFVDDEPAVHQGISRMLRTRRVEWALHFCDSVNEAERVVASHPIDVIVSDVNMPGKDGFDLLRAFKSDKALSEIPIVMLTGNKDHVLKRRALESGAIDLLSKPIDTEDLIARLRSVIRLRRSEQALRHQNEELEDRVRDRTDELRRTRNEIVWRLAIAAEHRDGNTGEHVFRVARAARELAIGTGMAERQADELALASMLHDVGKIGIPDAVLNKPGRLTGTEWDVMKGHCRIGSEMLICEPPIGVDRACGNPLLALASEVALCHHERWDGTGYPRGLRGEEIPLSARITSVVDVLDALCHARPYKHAIPFETSVDEVLSLSGTHFDPDVIALLSRRLPSLRDVLGRDAVR